MIDAREGGDRSCAIVGFHADHGQRDFTIVHLGGIALDQDVEDFLEQRSVQIADALRRLVPQIRFDRGVDAVEHARQDGFSTSEISPITGDALVAGVPTAAMVISSFAPGARNSASVLVTSKLTNEVCIVMPGMP